MSPTRLKIQTAVKSGSLPASSFKQLPKKLKTKAVADLATKEASHTL